MGPIGDALGLIISTLGSLYIGAVVVRFLLQASRADFYNPVSQSMVKITNPVILPFRKFIPGYGGYDIAALVVAFLLNLLATALLCLTLAGRLYAVQYLIGWSLVGLISLVLNIYFWALIIQIVASWIAPMSGNPILLLIYQLLDPVTSRVRRVIPPFGMLDISPIFVFLGIKVLELLIVNTLAVQFRVIPQLVIGI